jgi:hypothetical protein
MISVADNHFDSHRSSSASIKLKHHHADPRPNQAINVERSRDHGPYEGSSPHTQQQHRTNMQAPGPSMSRSALQIGSKGGHMTLARKRDPTYR